MKRFWSKIEKQKDGCWLWIGGMSSTGYGSFWFGGKVVSAHVASYEMAVAPVPPGMTLDHLCRNRACVNPDHLEVVTRGENVLRGESPSARHARKTHCERGHPLSGDNLRIERNGRRCIACQNARARERRARGARL